MHLKGISKYLRMENWIQEAVTNWKSHKVKLNPPATVTDIEQVESLLNFKFPQDFKEFYLCINGFEGLDWQEHMFTFWPLNMIISEFDEKENGFIGFSDYSLKVNAIGFKIGEEGIFKIYPSLKGEKLEHVASSFREIVYMINSNQGPIYWHG